MIDDHAKMINKKAGMAKINEATNLASFLVSYGAVIEPMNLMVNNGKKNNGESIFLYYSRCKRKNSKLC